MTRLLRVVVGALVAIVLLSSVLYAFNFAYTYRLRQAVSAYRGDGKAAITGTNFINYGFAIRFEPFDLAKDFDAQYVIGQIPRNNDKSYYVSLQAVCSLETIERIKSGILKLELISSGGERILEGSGPLKTWTYGETRDFATGLESFQIYYQPNYFEYTDIMTKRDLVVRVSYKAGEKMKQSLKGQVVIRSGGFY